MVRSINSLTLISFFLSISAVLLPNAVQIFRISDPLALVLKDSTNRNAKKVMLI